MTIALILALAALLLLAALALILRRRAARSAPLAAPLAPERRRAASLVAAPVVDSAPAATLSAAAPRRRQDIGLTPWDAEASAPATAIEEAGEPEAVDIEAVGIDTLEGGSSQPAPGAIVAAEIAPDIAPGIAPEVTPLVFDAPTFVDPPAPPPELTPPELAPLELAPLELARSDLAPPSFANDDGVAPPPDPSADDPPSILSQLKTKKKAGPNMLAGAIEGAPDEASSGPPVPNEIEEEVALVIRRQVPATDREPRSWIGGLPMMPDTVEWPCAVAPERLDEGEVPLNFVAQIHCADLPADLWGGLGPRSGWLLMFLNPLDTQGDDPRLFRLLHTEALGAERQPPAEIRAVVDPDFAERDYLWRRSVDELPVTWRRWPVDLVAGPNQAFADGDRIVVTPRDFAGQLYDGAAVETGRADIGDEVPFSWRGALYAVDAGLRGLAQPVAAARVAPGVRDVIEKPGYLAALVPEMRQREAAWLRDGDGAILAKEEPLTERQREARDRVAPLAAARKASIDRMAAFIAAHPGSAALIAAVERGAADEAAWRAQGVTRLEAIREDILAHPLDSALSGEEWDRLAAILDVDAHSRWIADWTSRNSDLPVMLVEQRLSLLDLARPGIEAGVAELAADYQSDPLLADLVPPHFFDGLEPYWRQLTDNRPHRMGGYHDGLQSDPEPGPQSELLLFQLASDEAMHWNWGDGGAYFVTISPRDLAAGRFDRAEIRLEQP